MECFKFWKVQLLTAATERDEPLRILFRIFIGRKIWPEYPKHQNTIEEKFKKIYTEYPCYVCQRRLYYAFGIRNNNIEGPHTGPPISRVEYINWSIPSRYTRKERSDWRITDKYYTEKTDCHKIDDHLISILNFVFKIIAIYTILKKFSLMVWNLLLFYWSRFPYFKAILSLILHTKI